MDQHQPTEKEQQEHDHVACEAEHGKIDPIVNQIRKLLEDANLKGMVIVQGEHSIISVAVNEGTSIMIAGWAKYLDRVANADLDRIIGTAPYRLFTKMESGSQAMEALFRTARDRAKPMVPPKPEEQIKH